MQFGGLWALSIEVLLHRADQIYVTRLDRLRRNQNRDGGWGYFPGKQSWIEPTVYAALALQKEPEANRASGRALEGLAAFGRVVETFGGGPSLDLGYGVVRNPGSSPRRCCARGCDQAEVAIAAGRAGWGWMEGSNPQ